MQLRPRVPDNTKRTVVLGRTGAGKTVFAMHLLSGQNWDKQPWVIIDYKSDELIERLEEAYPKYIRYLKPSDKPPDRPGLYIMRPLPDDDDEDVERFLKACWAKQDIGIYIDEGYMIAPTSRGLKAILTQGRSRRVPVIALYQRPVYMSRFAVAQADFFAAFEQNDERDLKTTASFVKPAIAPNGSKITVYSALPQYHCLWYDVGKGHSTVLKPAPSETEILETFGRRLLASNRKGAFI